MIFLLDTDTIIFVVRGLRHSQSTSRQREALKVIRRFRKVKSDGHIIGLSAISAAELEYGARLSRDYAVEITAVRKILTPFKIYDFEGVHASVEYGRVRADLRTRGEPIGAMDELIAAHALALGATLVSNNQAHFKRVPGLVTANWISGEPK